MEMSSEQLSRLTEHIYLKLGLRFEEKKSYFLQTRVEKRMEALGQRDPQEYLLKICFADPTGREMQELANLITTNETYMFREFEQLEAFANFCLPEVLSAKQAKGKQQLRIWSAGCSSGEEPYTLAIILQEVFPQSHYWDCEILATDIDERMLAAAAKRTYGWRSVREAPPEYLKKHFIQVDDQYRVRPATADLVKLQHLNLSDRIAMRGMRNMDFVFCRNVLIYFDDESRKSVVDQFYAALNPGGYLFLGHSESVGRISSAFKLKRCAGHLVYVKE